MNQRTPVSPGDHNDAWALVGFMLLPSLMEALRTQRSAPSRAEAEIYDAVYYRLLEMRGEPGEARDRDIVETACGIMAELMQIRRHRV